MTSVRVLPVGDAALLVELPDLGTTLGFAAALRAADLPGVLEIVPAARTVLVRHDPRRVDPGELRRRLGALEPVPVEPVPVEPVPVEPGRDGSVTIEVRYDGADLDEVAEHLGCSPAEVVGRHRAATWRVAFTGFAPGFAYLVGDDPRFDVPRRRAPRARVPAGSVALAGPFSSVYPREGPGGWQVIGRTDAPLWDVDRDPPALLGPGSTVRFVPAERELLSLVGSATPCPQPPPTGFAVEVVDPGLQVLVQDLGRPGHLALGVPAAGVADRAAAIRANRAVGNRGTAAVLELVGGGAVLRFVGAGVLGLAGADAPARLTARDGTRRPVPRERPTAVEDGDELTLGDPVTGWRTVLALRGGFAVAPVLGSRSRDTLSGLGPAPLTAGDRVTVLDPASAPFPVEPEPTGNAPAPGAVTDLDVVLGPRTDRFTPAAREILLAQTWQVTPRSDRVGLRLAGDVALERSRDDELPSEGMVPGAVQVPPDGWPVLFGRDHPVTGGYPVVAVVVDEHLDRLAQLPPGARVRFRRRDPDPPSGGTS
ncbi:carboxyltransferase domain-containing protein [Kineococcus gynurae]|uniref:Carboxyltransferase domain-containing protein n=1 Tax=Kineococcus gynurae TaxID=452979 RepID=A0ABV5LSV1_9ACTN